ncbi:MAG: CvpA family protein [Gammaproteobacteria bacterium]
MMTVDWVIIGIVALSTVVSLWRGATREIFSLITWALAIYLGVKFAGSLDQIFASFIESQSVRFAVCFILIFLSVMIVGGLLIRVLSKFISFTGLTLVDRLLGVGFGAVRGVLIIGVAIVLVGYTTIPQDKWYINSQLLPHFDGLSKSLSAWVQEQGFDPKKLETMIESVEGKANTKANTSTDSTDQGKPSIEQGTPSTDAGVPNILGVPVPEEDKSKPNMLGAPVVPPNN